MATTDPNTYSSCTYNAADTSNPFSNCITNNAVQTALNGYMDRITSGYNQEIEGVNRGLINNINQCIGADCGSTIVVGGVIGANGTGTSNANVEDNGYLAGQAAPYRWDFTNGGVKMYAKNNSLIEKRANMDGVISYMSSDKNILNMNDSSLLYNAYFYINMLWVILATSLIYYIFTEL